MKTALALALLASAALAAPVPKELKDKRPDYCPMAVGDKREYADPSDPNEVAEVREITAVEVAGGMKRFTMTLSATTGTMVMAVDKGGVVTLAEQNGQPLPGVSKIVAPDMKAGDSWATNELNGRTRTVGKAEKITVPAGEFTAVPVTISSPPGQGRADIVSWYADGVGLVRQDSGGRTALVLLKYTRGPEKK